MLGAGIGSISEITDILKGMYRGETVTNPKQAIAIAMSEAGMSKKKKVQKKRIQKKTPKKK